MSQTIRDVMTPSPVALSAKATALDAARAMRDAGIGDVVVLDAKANVFGIVTDRDIVVRAVAEGRKLPEVKLGDICSKALVTVLPTDTLDQAVQLAREQARLR